jgi:hypothetical protein
VFNIPVPGWLPPSASFGVDDIGNGYALYATAKVINLGTENLQNATWLDTLCSPFRSRQWQVDATPKPIRLTRFARIPSTGPPPPVPTSTYFVRPKCAPTDSPEEARIPGEVLDKIQILTSVPDYLDMDEAEPMPLTLRLRTKSLDTAHCSKLRMTGFQIKLVQKDKCRYVTCGCKFIGPI